jgi:UDP-N-acetylglucosamine 2-epimerase (non-hydrolysing)
MEAGNRCYDDRVPEEVNRRIIDHSSDVLMPYTERSRQNLVREGIAGERILVTGNPINEVLDFYSQQIAQSRILTQLGVEAGRYFLVTMHRAENVDLPDRLKSLTEAFARLQTDHGLPVIISTHPHTKARLKESGLDNLNRQIRYLPPFGFFDFISLEQQAFCVLSDSGTVQEECAIFGVPNVTIRDVTERPETVECGSNILSGATVESVLRCVKAALRNRALWQPPAGYVAENVSAIASKIILGYHQAIRH